MAKPRIPHVEKRISGVAVRKDIVYGSSANENIVEIRGNEFTRPGLWLIMISYEIAGTMIRTSGQNHMEVLVYPTTNFSSAAAGDIDRIATSATSTYKYNEPIPSQGFMLLYILPHELTSAYFLKLYAFFSGSGLISNVKLFGICVEDMESEGAFTADTTGGYLIAPNNMVPFCSDIFLNRIYNRNYTGTFSDRYLAMATIGVKTGDTNEMGPIGFRLSHAYETVTLDEGAYITIPRLHTYQASIDKRPFLTMLPFRSVTDFFDIRLHMRYKGTNAVVTDSFTYSASLVVIDLEYFDNVTIGSENATRGFSTTCPGAMSYNDDAPNGSAIPATDPITREPWPGSNRIPTTSTWSPYPFVSPNTLNKWGTCSISHDGVVILAGVYSLYGNPGPVWRSTNSGTSWTNAIGSRNWAASAMSSSGQYQYIGSYSGPSSGGVLYKSSNYGASFTEITSATFGLNWKNWSTISTSNNGSKVLVGCGDYSAVSGRAFISSDYGVSWTTIPVNNVHIRCSAMSGWGDKLYLGSYNGRLYRSHDSGASWIEMQPAGAVNKYWNLLSCSEDGLRVIAGAQSGRLYCSADGGLTWAETQPAGDTSKNWINSAMSSDGKIVVVSDSDSLGKLYYSSNGGSTWQIANAPTSIATTSSWLALAMTANGQTWVGGPYNLDTYLTGAGQLYKIAFAPGIQAIVGINSQYDVDKDGYITSNDVTAIINYLNQHGSQPVIIGVNDKYDVNGDGTVSPQDVLSIINYINSSSTVGDAFYFNNGSPITLNATSSPVFSLAQANWQLPNSSPLWTPEPDSVKESNLYFYVPGLETIATPADHKSTISIHTFNNVYPTEVPQRPGNFQEKLTRSAFGSYPGGPYLYYRPPVLPISHFLVSDSTIGGGNPLSACVRGQPPDMSYIWAQNAPNREIGMYSAYPETRSGRNEDRFWVSFELTSYHDYNEPSNDTLYTKSLRAFGTGVYTGHSAISHTTDASLLLEYSKIHFTNAWFYEFLFHRTNAALAAEHSLAMTTNALLLSEIARTQTTDAFLVFEYGLQQTTNALLLAEVTLTHTVDALLAEEHSIDQTTDSLLLKTEALSHSTDSNLYGVIQHSTDALLLAERELTHTTDSSLVWTRDLSHSTDADLYGVLHQSTDALLFSVGTKIQTTNALIMAEEEYLHTTDALLLKENSLSHSTDAYLAQVVVHYTDALLQAEMSLGHTTDALLKIQRNIAHTTDAWIYGYKSQTVDALLQKIDIPKIHRTNALLYETHPISHTVDSLLAEEHDISHTTDGLLHWETFGSGVLSFNGFRIVSTGDEEHREYTQDVSTPEINEDIMANWTRKEHGAYQYRNVTTPRLKTNKCFPCPDDNPTEG